MGLVQLIYDHPVVSGLFIGYLLSVILHQILIFQFKFKGPAVGERLILDVPETRRKRFGQKQERFRINYTEHSPKSPVIVFESHLGLTLECWGYAQKELQETVSTLSYDRLGYGTFRLMGYFTV
jgi:hypothetical protein